MTIILDSVVRNPVAGQKAGVPVSTKADLATGAFDLASKNVGQQVDASNVQLSPYGQVKSSFVDVQSAGRTLSTPAKTSTVEDITKAVQSLANAYNNATRIIDTASNSTGAIANSGYANSARLDLNSIVTSGSNTADLKNIGVNVNQDGTLTVDIKALQNAAQINPGSVQDTLAKVGVQAVQVSQRELAGNVGGGGSTLSTRAKYPGTKVAGQQSLAVDPQNTDQQQTGNSGNIAAGGIAAYRQMIFL